MKSKKAIKTMRANLWFKLQDALQDATQLNNYRRQVIREQIKIIDEILED